MHTFALAVVMLLPSYIQARRAMLVDPMVVLRHEGCFCESLSKS